MKTVYFLIFLLIPLGVIAGGCSDKKEEGTNLAMEIAARKLGDRASAFESAGRPDEAAKMYAELGQKYGDTKYYAEIKSKLEKKGVSVQASLESKTSKRMFKLQRTIIGYKASKGKYPVGHAINIPKDMWGTTIMYKIGDKNNRKYKIFIQSKGPDKIKDTDDDLYLLYNPKKSGEAKKREGEGGSESELMTHKRWSSKQSEDAGASSGGRDKTVSLEELKKNKGTGRYESKEKVVTLEELLSGKK